MALKWLKFFILFSLVMTTEAWALADGWKVKLGAGWSRSFMGQADTVPKARDVSRNNVGYKVAIGYQLSENFAADFSYLYFSKADYKFENNVKRGVTTQAISPSIVFILPAADRFDIHVRAGFYQSMVARSRGMSFRGSRKPRSQFAFNYGIGADYALSPAFGIGLDWDQLLAGSRNAMLSLNVIYHFND